LAAVVREHFLNRFQKHALRAAERPNRQQPPVANAVVDGAARDPQDLGGAFDADASSDLRLQIVLAEFGGVEIHARLIGKGDA